MKRFLALVALGALLAMPAAVLAHGAQFTASLSAEAEVPPPTVPSDYEGTGMGLVTVNEAHTELTFEVTFSGLTGPLTMSHIHYGAPGAAGPPMFWLTDMTVMTGTPSPLSGTLTEADFMPVTDGPQTFAEALEALEAGNTYINLHTQQNQPGEIRGQLEMAELPDTATESGTPPAGMPWTLILAALGLAVLLPVARGFAVRRS